MCHAALILCATLLPASSAFLLVPGGGGQLASRAVSSPAVRPASRVYVTHGSPSRSRAEQPAAALRNAPRMSSGGTQSAWEAMVDRVVEDLNKGVAKYIFVRGVDPETASELRAAVVVAGRGYRRRNAPAEGAPAPSLDEVVKAVHSLVKVAIVDREGLVSEEEWEKMARGFTQAKAIVNEDGEERPAEAPPLTLDEVVVQLRRLFPNASPEEVEEAARRGGTLKTATDLIMTSSVPLTRLSARPAVAPRNARPRAAEAVPPGGEGCLLTKPVNGGASAFGLFFDICAKEHPICVNELRMAASAGLNFGAGKPVGVQVSVCTSGTARGKEMDPSAWSRVYTHKALNLPMASWYDERPNYGVLKLEQGVEVAAGQVVGVCIHTADVNGLAIRMARRQAGIDSDMTDDDFGGKDQDDEVGGALRDSYSIGQVTDEDPCVEIRCGYTACSASLDLPLVSAPIPAAFVGAISYTRMA